MQKLLWIVALILAFLFRDSLPGMAPLEGKGLSFPAVLTASLGGVFAFLAAYTFVKTMELDAVWEVASLIVVSGVLANLLGHWLGGFPVFGDFWGGFIAGTLETAILWGALYGAKEVWKGTRD